MSKQYGLYNDDPVMMTFTEKWVNVFNPDPDTLDIVDIAHHLSYQCRFGGAVKKYYSVAEHCCRGVEMAEPEHKFDFLMHDSSEAYMQDIIRPVKLKLANYKEIEDNMMIVLSKKFGFKYPLHPRIKEIDEFMLQVEWACIMKMEPKHDFTPWHPNVAKRKFLELFNELKP
jgi:hypothetical protein